jgi:hypothetical protein
MENGNKAVESKWSRRLEKLQLSHTENKELPSRLSDQL